MKRAVILFIILSAGIIPTLSAQSQEAQQLLLNVEKLSQLKQILTDMKKGYQVISTGYNTIEGLSKQLSSYFSSRKSFTMNVEVQ